jgi:hypothetical protein
MGVILLIVLGIVLLTVALAYVGQRVGAQMEQPHLGAGTTEQHMRTALSPSVLGALLGILPFLVFTIVLIYMSIQVQHEIAAQEAREAAEAARP